jgi:Glycosyl transferase family 11
MPKSSKLRANAASKKAAKTKNTKLATLLLLIALTGITVFGLSRRRDARQTITFGEIGRYGRLGNQLFQVASTIGIARARNLSYAFPKRIEQSVVGGMFGIKGTIPDKSLASIPVMQEMKEGYYDVQIPSGTPILSLHGFFQSHWYFSSQNEELKKIMHFRPSIIQNVRSGCPEINLKNTVGIHIRTTDYLNYPNIYRILGRHYYEKALEMLHNSTGPLDAIIIAAADKDEAFQLLSDLKKLYDVPITISPFFDPAYDLALLTMCRNLIIANSAFSWWAAYLNMLQSYNGTVFAPSPWYKPDGHLAHLNSLYFYLPHWHVLHEDLLNNTCSSAA